VWESSGGKPNAGSVALIRTMRIKKRYRALKAYGHHQPDWLVVDQDECWFSRFAQVGLHTWAAHQADRLVQRETGPTNQPKALTSLGAVCQRTAQRYVYFCDGQPNTDKVILMLKRLLAIARDLGRRGLAIFWDQASWHKRKKLKRWLRAHNRQAKQSGDVRLLTLLLPSKSPWLNSMEPHWVHAKRKMAEFDGKLPLTMLKRRLCAHFQVPLIEAHLK
jgi:hypothetical protein